MRKIKIFILVIIFSCQNKKIKESDFLYDKNGNQFVSVDDDLNNEFVIIKYNDTICENDTSEIIFYPKYEKFSFLKLYEYHEFKTVDSVLVDTVNQKIINIKEIDVFDKDTLFHALISGKNKNDKNHLSKGPILCFLIKDKTNGVFHLVKKQDITVIVKCDSLEKIKYYTPNLVFPKNN